MSTEQPINQSIPRDFLEQAPLYKSYKWAGTKQNYAQIPIPSIQVYCSTCKESRTLTQGKAEYFGIDARHISGATSADLFLTVTYTCGYCTKFLMAFLIKITEDALIKVGQYPALDISVEPMVRKFLGDYYELYKKGVTCENFGYGIASYAYYRRVLENLIDKLLGIVEEIIDDADKLRYKDALEQTKSAQTGSDKIDLIKDLLPPILRPNGINPLGTLYGILSEGIHDMDDDECLEIAQEVRTSLVFVIQQLEYHKQISSTYTESMRKILDKRQSRITPKSGSPE